MSAAGATLAGELMVVEDAGADTSVCTDETWSDLAEAEAANGNLEEVSSGDKVWTIAGG